MRWARQAADTDFVRPNSVTLRGQMATRGRVTARALGLRLTDQGIRSSSRRACRCMIKPPPGSAANNCPVAVVALGTGGAEGGESQAASGQMQRDAQPQRTLVHRWGEQHEVVETRGAPL